MAKAHFGVTVPQIKRPWVAAADTASAFEDLGYDSIWVCDHFYGPQSPQLPILEAWSMVAALAAITERVEIGTLVTPAGMRNAAQLGKVIATADNIAGGRIIAGLGAGWMAREFTEFGKPRPVTGFGIDRGTHYRHHHFSGLRFCPFLIPHSIVFILLKKFPQDSK